jgi:hypothetical protein
MKADAPKTPTAVRDLVVSQRRVSELKPYDNNSRKHSKKQLNQIAASIRTFGFTVPVLIDAESLIMAGHGRVEAAKLLGMRTVPCIAIEDLSEEQKRAYIIADNRIAENATWDPEILRVELETLSSVDLSFDLEIIGFEMAEIDTILDGGDVVEKGLEKILGKGAKRDKPDPADTVEEADRQKPAITQPGMIWIMGEHRLLCGDALKPESYDALLRPDSWDALDEVDLVSPIRLTMSRSVDTSADWERPPIASSPWPRAR